MDTDPHDGLTADFTIDGETAVITVVGEIDIATRDVLAGAVEAASHTGATRLVLDMAGVTFMDSSGIAALIDARTVAHVLLRRPSENVERLIAITGLTEIFDLEP